MKVGYLIALLFVGAYADNCGDTIVSPFNSNVKAVIDYVGADGTANSMFTISFNNPVPEESYPNNPQKATVDVHSFALIDPNTGIKPAHLDFGMINGGAFMIKNFSIPNGRTGSNKCLDVAFYYQTATKQERFFYGSFTLATSSKKRFEPAVEEMDLASRATCTGNNDITYPVFGDWVSDTAGTISNTWYFTVGDKAAANVKYDVSDPNGQIIISYAGGDTGRGPFSLLAAGTAKNGSLTFAGCTPNAQFTLNILTTYKCNGTPQQVPSTKKLVCNSS